MTLNPVAIGFRTEDIEENRDEWRDTTHEEACCFECGTPTTVFTEGPGACSIEAENPSSDAAREVSFQTRQDVRLEIEASGGFMPLCTRCALRVAPPRMTAAIRQAHERIGIDVADSEGGKDGE